MFKTNPETNRPPELRSSVTLPRPKVMYTQEYSLLPAGNEEVSEPGGAGWEGSSCLSVLRCANRKAFPEELLGATGTPNPRR